MIIQALAFYAFAAVLVASGVMVVASVLVVGQRNPIYSVFLLIVSFVALAGLYILLGASFAAMIQVNARVPYGIKPGYKVPVVLRIGQGTSQSGVTMAVE